MPTSGYLQSEQSALKAVDGERDRMEASSESRWYAVHTRARHEKVVAEELSQRDIESFLPLRETTSQWKDRLKQVQRPLFPGYLFARFPARKRRVDVLRLRSVVRIVGFNGEPQPIPDEQIQTAKTLVFSTLPYVGSTASDFLQS